MKAENYLSGDIGVDYKEWSVGRDEKRLNVRELQIVLNMRVC